MGKISFYTFLLLISAIGLTSCDEDKKENDASVDQELSPDKDKRDQKGPKRSIDTKPGKGNVAVGGTLSLAFDEKYNSLFPQSISDLTSSQIATQIFDGLLKFNSKSLEVEPAIADSYSVSEDGMVYTFKLNPDAKFHNDACFKGSKGRNITAADFKYTFELLCNADNESAKFNYESIFKDVVEGANAYHKGTAQKVSGFIVEDDHTFKIRLTKPQASLLYKLAQSPTSVIAEEAYKKYGEDITVGSGPFEFSEFRGNSLYLSKNKDYYMKDEHGNQLPYLDSVRFIFAESKSKEVTLFENKEIDVLEGLPADRVTEMVQERIHEITGTPPEKILIFNPELSTQYYEFNMTRPHFKDVRVRKAFNYAIDRERIKSNVLKNQAFKLGEYGLTTPVKILKDYPFDSLAKYGYSYNPEKAKQLMAEAGYPDGKGFPILKLEINSGGNIHNQIAKEVIEQLQETLGINISQDVVPFAEKIEDAKYGRADMFRSAWVADYPDPETYLINAYGANVPNSMDEPSYPNTMRYKNPVFDKYFEAGLRATNKEDRYENFYKAEKAMLQDPPLMILWYTEDYKFYYAYVRNYVPNALQYLDLTNVYLKKWTEEEWVQAHH